MRCFGVSALGFYRPGVEHSSSTSDRQMYLGVLEGETSTFNSNREGLAQTQTQEQQPVSG